MLDKRRTLTGKEEGQKVEGNTCGGGDWGPKSQFSLPAPLGWSGASPTRTPCEDSFLRGTDGMGMDGTRYTPSPINSTFYGGGSMLLSSILIASGLSLRESRGGGGFPKATK